MMDRRTGQQRGPVYVVRVTFRNGPPRYLSPASSLVLGVADAELYDTRHEAERMRDMLGSNVLIIGQEYGKVVDAITVLRTR